MPYYCTVPRCTSLAGKAKNVSFHQFPKDKQLASHWNKILKRGKPYTKYSKVCSLHFTPADYVITSVGKNKGQWRTLRKDAVPSLRLPAETPPATTHHRRTTTSSHSAVPNIDPLQMAQAIYMQTMIALHTTNSCAPQLKAWSAHAERPAPEEGAKDQSPSPTTDRQDQCTVTTKTNQENHNQFANKASYKCEQCSKCFKDPDVYLIHTRTHQVNPGHQETVQGKENKHMNGTTSQETLRANPILANLLNTDGAGRLPDRNVYDTNALLSFENQVMVALNANMHNYIMNMTMSNTTVTSSRDKRDEESDIGDNDEPSDGCDDHNDDFDGDEYDDESSEGQAVYQANMLAIRKKLVQDAQTTVDNQSSCSDRNVGNSHRNLVHDEDFEQDTVWSDQNSVHNELNSAHEDQQMGNHLSGQSEGIRGSGERESQGSDDMEEPICDNKDLDYTKDSTNLLIDENT